MVRDTSLLAFTEFVQDEEKLGSQQRIVLECIKKSYGVSDRMISQRTGLDRNVVPARRGELEKVGLVKPGFKAVCPIGKKLVYMWVFKDYD